MMTRTRSEVKRILIECSSNRPDCGQCPIAIDRKNGIVSSGLWECTEEPLRNALEYIMELEAEVAEALGSNPQTIRMAAHQGTLGFPCIIMGTRVRIPRKPFLEFLGEATV